jgi:3-hydroxyacyl-CoA dehydrogenase
VSTIKIWIAVAVLTAVVSGGTYVVHLYNKSRDQARAIEILTQSVETLQKDLKRDQLAQTERAERLNRSEASHEEFIKEIEVCDIPDMSIPPGLYERLCRPAPAYNP